MAIKAEICTLGNYLPWKLAITRCGGVRRAQYGRRYMYICLSFVLFTLASVYACRNILGASYSLLSTSNEPSRREKYHAADYSVEESEPETRDRRIFTHKTIPAAPVPSPDRVLSPFAISSPILSSISEQRVARKTRKAFSPSSSLFLLLHYSLFSPCFISIPAAAAAAALPLSDVPRQIRIGHQPVPITYQGRWEMW